MRIIAVYIKILLIASIALGSYAFAQKNVDNVGEYGSQSISCAMFSDQYSDCAVKKITAIAAKKTVSNFKDDYSTSPNANSVIFLSQSEASLFRSQAQQPTEYLLVFEHNSPDAAVLIQPESFYKLDRIPWYLSHQLSNYARIAAWKDGNSLYSTLKTNH